MSEFQVEEVQEVKNFEQPDEQSKYVMRERTGACKDEGTVEKSHSVFSFRIVDMMPQSMRSFGEKIYGFFYSNIRRAFTIVCNSSWLAFSSIIVLLAPLMMEYRQSDRGAANKRTPYGRNTVIVI